MRGNFGAGVDTSAGGGLVGALIYMLVYSNIEGSWLFGSIAGGKVMLAEASEKYSALFSVVPGVLLATGIGVVFMLLAWKLPAKA